MKYFFLLSFFLVLVITNGQSTDRLLFQIVKNDKIGFIDNSGKTVIQPIFRAAGHFSEGLAPARINGIYGYIDSIGQFILQTH